MRISVVGLGKLGSPMCAVFASVGHAVIGVDLDQAKVDAVNNHHAPVNEPGLEELIQSFGSNLQATTDVKYAIENSDITFIVVLTPSQENGFFSLKYVLPVCRNIAQVLATKDEYHTVVVTSTVMPGHTAEITNELEQTSGKKAGVDFGVCYSPEFIALGSVVNDMRTPDMILIGTDHPRSGDILEEICRSAVSSSPVIKRVHPVEAELAKISINTFVTTKIAYANMIADFCEKFSGADVDVVTSAIGSDSRIGRKYLKGGISFGGPCFPRDNVALKALGESLGLDVALPREVHNSNERRVARLVDWVVTNFVGQKVAILGITYKPNSEVIEESAGWKIMTALLNKQTEISAYDPVFSKPFPAGVQRISDLQNIEAEVVLVMLPYSEVANLDADVFSGCVVVDCWRILPHLAGQSGLRYIPVGIGA
jgi:UDPglucose 6-dehydrogenase